MAFDVFLKLDGIDGESTYKDFQKWITIESFSWGVTNAAPVGGAGAGKPALQELHVVSPLQISSPKLFQKAAEGAIIKTGELDVLTHGSLSFLKIELTDILVSSFTMSGHLGDTLPKDSFSLRFARISESVAQRGPQGALIGDFFKYSFDFLKLVPAV